jgi:hypothetical protein
MKRTRKPLTAVFRSKRPPTKSHSGFNRRMSLELNLTSCRAVLNPTGPSWRIDMKALCWHGKSDVRVDNIPDPKIQHPGDAIIKITATAICGSDLHLFDGYQPTMEAGDILGHEPMGAVVEVGSAVTKLKKGDRVVVPFVIACGSCFFCKRTEFSCCDTTNPNAELARKAMGQSPPDSLAFHTCLVDMPADKPNTFAYHMRMSARLKSNPRSRTRRCFFSPTFSRPAAFDEEVSPILLEEVAWRSNIPGRCRTRTH